MKKLVLLLITLVFLTGCTDNNYKQTGDTVETKDGIYDIKDLVKREDLSTKYINVYCLEKDSKEEKPDQVSLKKGINDYTINNNLAFKNYIPSQIYHDFGEDIRITGNTLTTTKDNMVYKYMVIKEDAEAEITLYYIIGNYKYIYVQETNYSKNPDFDKVVYNIVDTFEWKE